MKKLYVFFLFLLFTITSAQNLEKVAKDIVAEGITLYRSEMASWYGTDVFVSKYEKKENIGGYFSYIIDGVPKCVFFSKENKVIGTIAFPTNYNPNDAKLDLAVRNFTAIEKKYFDLQQKARARIASDTIFKKYDNTNFNIIPIITGTEKKVYVMTGTNANNVVLFGNDYLIEINDKGEISKSQPLHKSLLIQKINDEKIGKSVSGSHSHVLEDWPYITATDICTLMLYQKFTNWKSYEVVSKKYSSLYNPENYNLIILPSKTVKKIRENQNKKNPKNVDDEE